MSAEPQTVSQTAENRQYRLFAAENRQSVRPCATHVPERRATAETLLLANSQSSSRQARG